MPRVERRRGAGWVPLATGARREACLHQALIIGEALRGCDAVALGPSLSSGAAGVALFFDALDAAAPGRGFAEERARLIDAAVAAIAESAGEPGLYGGFSGVAFAVEQLADADADDDDDDDANADVDAALAEILDVAPGGFDLVSGACGLAVYARERDGAAAADLRARLVARLAATATHDADGAAWWTAPRPLVPRAHVDLGLAHGLPGVIATLAAEQDSAARALCDAALRWLFAHVGRDGLAYAVPASSPVSRVAWCYGDAGAAVALALTARARDDAAVAEVALAAGRRAAARARGDDGVADASLCHGAAGLMHVFARLHQYCGEPAFAEAAVRWIDATLAYAESGRGVGGYRYVRNDERVDSAGFLEGAAGIGLALVAATSERDPCWDRALLLSLRDGA